MALAGDVKRVMAIGAHPDDCELLAGGTLALFANRGAAVFICSLARGDKGSRDGEPSAIAARRRKEAESAARSIGAEFTCLDISDGEIQSGLELRRQLIDAVRRCHPDLIITHWAADYHADHRETSILATDASWYAASPGHVTGHAALPAAVPVFYMDTVAGLDFEPTEFVDISNAWSAKEEMLRCHASQHASSAQHGSGDLTSLVYDLARFRGRQCGVEYAEAFRPCLKWQRVRPYRLLP